MRLMQQVVTVSTRHWSGADRTLGWFQPRLTPPPLGVPRTAADETKASHPRHRLFHYPVVAVAVPAGDTSDGRPYTKCRLTPVGLLCHSRRSRDSAVGRETTVCWKTAAS